MEGNMVLSMKDTAAVKEGTGWVYCLICTHTVPAKVVMTARKHFVKAGQKCSRCSSSLDPSYVVRVDAAA
jgi:hypothetical protein